MSYSKVQKAMMSADSNRRDARKWQMGGMVAENSVQKLLELFETKKERSKRYDEIVDILDKTGNKDSYAIPSKFKYLLGKEEATFTDKESGESLPFNMNSLYGLGLSQNKNVLDKFMNSLGISPDEGLQEYFETLERDE